MEHPERAVPAARSGTDAVTALDLVVTDAGAGLRHRLLPAGPAMRLAAALATRPATVLRRGAALAATLGGIGLGVAGPTPSGPRYAHPAWRQNPLLRRAAQAHEAATGAAVGLLDDAGLRPADRARLGSAVELASGALAPSTTPLNPLAWRAAADTRGASAVRGLRRLARDVATPPRLPATADRDAFEIGTDLAATPGAVVLRTPVLELIQYLPQTRYVREVPLLVVPPLLNRYYVADLAPGRSLVEHLVRGGQQVFAISWRNPDAEHAGWDLDTYGRGVLDAMDACERITRTDRTAIAALCAGGVVTAMLLAHLAAVGSQDRVATVTFAATLLDQRVRGGVPPDESGLRAAVAASARAGYLDGRSLAGALAWQLPDDLVWGPAVRGYLCGTAPEPSQLRHWGADTTRLTAGAHRDLVDLALSGGLGTPGTAVMLGTPVDLSKVDRDTYVVAGATDPLVDWPACYRTTALLGGESRFVLAEGSHVAAVTDPPPRIAVSPAASPDPQRWLEAASERAGSWWQDLLGWLRERSGDEREAAPELGGRGLYALHPAPGTYVSRP
jgi:polyhydroxyalkanoate synthase